ncbi:transcriptional repressor [Gammaproteobacteria bacterium]|nr:transcriptional repressor [Gammaproteobacteria bacterium]
MTAPENSTVNILERKCQQKGVRITSIRHNILSVLAGSESYLSVSKIYDLLASKNLNSNMTSIYRNVAVLESVGVLQSYRFNLHQTVYQVVCDSHDHLIDLGTGEITELHNPDLEKVKAEISRQYGFNPKDCRVELYLSSEKKHLQKSYRSGK